MARLLRAPPVPWFFLKNTALLQTLRLPRSITQKRQLPCPSLERLCRRKLEPGLVALKSLLLGVLRLLCWTTQVPLFPCLPSCFVC
jgi:hypothetical protein